MSKATATASSGGTSVFGIMGLIFVLCKIFDVAPIAGWSWWLVTLPFWGGLALIFALIALGFLIAGIVTVVAATLDHFSRR